MNGITVTTTEEVVRATMTGNSVVVTVTEEPVTAVISDGVVFVDGIVGYPNRQTFNPTNGQTVFTVTTPAQQPSLSELTLNGVQQQYAVDYMLDNVTLTWLSGVTLTTTDIFIIQYW